MRVNWRAAKNSKQPGQRVAVCLVEGLRLRFPPLLWGAIQPHSQWPLKENTNSPIAQPWASSTAVFRGEMFFPCVDGSQLKAGPCYVDTAGWCSNHLQRPSMMTKWNEKDPHTRCNTRTRALHRAAAQQELHFHTSHQTLMRLNGFGFVLHSARWYFSLWS